MAMSLLKCSNFALLYNAMTCYTLPMLYWVRIVQPFMSQGNWFVPSNSALMLSACRCLSMMAVEMSLRFSGIFSKLLGFYDVLFI